jgi:hypothetical protein
MTMLVGNFAAVSGSASAAAVWRAHPFLLTAVGMALCFVLSGWWRCVLLKWRQPMNEWEAYGVAWTGLSGLVYNGFAW